MSCIVYRCPGLMDGQMISCAAHWSLLPMELRLEVVEAWDQLALERRSGNPRRATRDRLRRLTSQAGSDLDEARRQLEARGGRAVGTDGRAWLREIRRLDAEQAAAAATEEHTTTDGQLQAALEAQEASDAAPA